VVNINVFTINVVITGRVLCHCLIGYLPSRDRCFLRRHARGCGRYLSCVGSRLGRIFLGHLAFPLPGVVIIVIVSVAHTSQVEEFSLLLFDLAG